MTKDKLWFRSTYRSELLCSLKKEIPMSSDSKTTIKKLAKISKLLKNSPKVQKRLQVVTTTVCVYCICVYLWLSELLWITVWFIQIETNFPSCCPAPLTPTVEIQSPFERRVCGHFLFCSIRLLFLVPQDARWLCGALSVMNVFVWETLVGCLPTGTRVCVFEMDRIGGDIQCFSILPAGQKEVDRVCMCILSLSFWLAPLRWFRVSVPISFPESVYTAAECVCAWDIACHAGGTFMCATVCVCEWGCVCLLSSWGKAPGHIGSCDRQPYLSVACIIGILGRHWQWSGGGWQETGWEMCVTVEGGEGEERRQRQEESIGGKNNGAHQCIGNWVQSDTDAQLWTHKRTLPFACLHLHTVISSDSACTFSLLLFHYKNMPGTIRETSSQAQNTRKSNQQQHKKRCFIRGTSSPTLDPYG